MPHCFGTVLVDASGRAVRPLMYPFAHLPFTLFPSPHAGPPLQSQLEASDAAVSAQSRQTLSHPLPRHDALSSKGPQILNKYRFSGIDHAAMSMADAEGMGSTTGIASSRRSSTASQQALSSQRPSKSSRGAFGWHAASDTEQSEGDQSEQDDTSQV